MSCPNVYHIKIDRCHEVIALDHFTNWKVAEEDPDSHVVSVRSLESADVLSPVDFGRIPEERIKDVISQMFTHLNKRRDGSYSLAFRLALKGGMPGGLLPASTNAVDLIRSSKRGIKDDDLAAIIRVNISKEIEFEVTVKVASKKYKFPGEDKLRDARIITVKPFGSCEEFFTFLKRFAAGVSFKETAPYSTNAMRDFVLGVPQSEEDEKRARDDLNRAFEDRRGFSVIISQDGAFLDFMLETSAPGTCAIL